MGESKVAQKVNHIREASRDDEVAVPGQLPKGKLEYGRLVHVFGLIGLGHGQFIEVGKEGSHRPISSRRAIDGTWICIHLG